MKFRCCVFLVMAHCLVGYSSIFAMDEAKWQYLQPVAVQIFIGLRLIQDGTVLPVLVGTEDVYGRPHPVGNDYPDMTYN